MAISATTGLVSGTDYQTLINNLISADEQAIEPTKTKLSTAESTLSTVQALNTAFAYATTDAETMSDVATFRARTATAGDEDVFAATASSDAAIGTYQIRVDALAQAEQQLGAATDAETTYTGTLTLTVGDGRTYTYAAEDTSLESIVAAINHSTISDVTAQIVDLGDGTSRLMLTSDVSGAGNTITIGGDLASTGHFAGMTTITEAQDASITLRLGSDSSVEITRTSSSNSVTDVVTGVDLALTAVSDDFTSLAIATDTTSISNRIQLFIEDLNSALSAYGSAASYDTSSETSGVLFSNWTIRSEITGLHTTMASLTDAGESLETLGITYDESTGQYSLDTDVLDTLLAGDSDAVARILIDGGLGGDIYDALDDLTGSSTGVLSTEEDALNSAIDLYEDQIEDFDTSIEAKRERYQAQFLALEKTLASLDSQKQSLTAFTDSLNKSDS